jgi:hypothetical protein
MYPKVGQYERVAASFRVHVPVCATASAAINGTSATARIIGVFITLNLQPAVGADFSGMLKAFVKRRYFQRK